MPSCFRAFVLSCYRAIVFFGAYSTLQGYSPMQGNLPEVSSLF